MPLHLGGCHPYARWDFFAQLGECQAIFCNNLRTVSKAWFIQNHHSKISYTGQFTFNKNVLSLLKGLRNPRPIFQKIRCLRKLALCFECGTWLGGRKKALPVLLKRASRSREDSPWDPVISLWRHLLIASPWGTSFKIESLRGLACTGHSKVSWQDLRLSHVPKADSCCFGYVYPFCLPSFLYCVTANFTDHSCHSYSSLSTWLALESLWNSSLGVSVRAFAESFSWEGKTHLECRRNYLMGGGLRLKWKERKRDAMEHQRPSLCILQHMDWESCFTILLLCVPSLGGDGFHPQAISQN